MNGFFGDGFCTKDYNLTMDIFLQPRWYPLGSGVDKLFVGPMLGYGL